MIFSSAPDCFPITIPTNDPYFTTSCMDFSRSAAAASSCAPGMKTVTTGRDSNLCYCVLLIESN